MNWKNLLDQDALAVLLPAESAHFARPVCEGLALFLEGLPEQRQTEILAQQMSMSGEATFSERLATLARTCPVLHKFGQILARDSRLSMELRVHLQELESTEPTLPWSTVVETIEQELGSLSRLGITLLPPALAEASVSVVIPFQFSSKGQQRDGVLKVLKPGIRDRLEEELSLLERVGEYLDQRCDELRLPHLDYQESFQQVREKLVGEVQLEKEQAGILVAREFYRAEKRVQIPELYDFCTSGVTAMQRVWGTKVTDHRLPASSQRNQLAETIVKSILAKPMFQAEGQAPFHADPHAGNLFLTTDGRLAILDWSLVGHLEKSERNSIVQLLLATATHNPRRMQQTLCDMADRGGVDQPALSRVVNRHLQRVRWGEFPGFDWLLGLLDDAAGQGRLRLATDLIMFRKSLFALRGVVADVATRKAIFDRVMLKQFCKHFALEWPARYCSFPSSRNFATGLSNFDIGDAILSLPGTTARLALGLSLDSWQRWLAYDAKHA